MRSATRGRGNLGRIESNQGGQERTASGSGSNPFVGEMDLTWTINPEKKVIEPDHGFSFKPNATEVVHKILFCMTNKFDHPWPSWKKVPQDIREVWFREFQKSYQWHPQHSIKLEKISKVLVVTD